MPLKISTGLKKSIQDEKSISKADVEDYVWNHKPHECFLCGSQLNRASDDIEIDHNQPVNEGGKDEFSNLNLVHVECNRYKRNHSSFDVRPHLKFKRFYDSKMGQVRFGQAREFFDLKTSDVYLKIAPDGKTANIEYEGGDLVTPIFSEKNSVKEQLFCFADLPISCIQNDDDIQPREIKINHLLAISADLKKNPLHEQPAVRLVGALDKKELLMFDGQHKTVAQLLNGKNRCTFKIYINIEKDEAVQLVNSIQARIKKLPLTPFELASKMSDEVRRKLEAYEDQVGSTEVSEEGFIQWLDVADRNRAKSGIDAAVIDGIIGDDELAFTKLIESRSAGVHTDFPIKEAAFQSNVLKTLLHTKPLSSAFKGDGMKDARERERRNVIKILNLCYNKGFLVLPDRDVAAEQRRIKRLVYQASLRQMCEIMLQIIASQLMVDKNLVLVEKALDDTLTDKLSAAAEKFFSHPVWTSELSKGSKAQLFQDALSKNQTVDEAFKAVGLTAAYCAGLEKLANNWAGS